MLSRITFLMTQLLFFLLLFSFFTPNISVAQSQTTVLPVIDGQIHEAEYNYSLTIKPSYFVIHWTIDLSHQEIYFGIVAATTGWVALGIDPTDVMNQADMIFGFVSTDGSQTVIDAFSDGKYGPHPADTESGGTNDITTYSLTESTTSLTFEFKRQLNTGDSRDKPIENRTMSFIWATGLTDDWTSKHNDAGSFTYNLFVTSTGNTDVTLETSNTARSPAFSYFILALSLSVIIIPSITYAKNRN